MTPPPPVHAPTRPVPNRTNRIGCIVAAVILGLVSLCGGAGFLAFRTGMANGAEAEREFGPKVEAALRATTPKAMNAQFPKDYRSSETAVKIFQDGIRAKLGKVRSVRCRGIVGFRTYRGVPSYDLITADYDVVGERGSLAFRVVARKDGPGRWELFRIDPL